MQRTIFKSADELIFHFIKFKRRFNLNLDNIEYVKILADELYASLCIENSFSINHINKQFVKHGHDKHGVKTCSDVCLEYYLYRGYSKEFALENISFLQRKRSKRCKEFWINKGYSQEDAIQKVSEIQRAYTNLKTDKIKNNKEYAKSISVWSTEYWIKRGLSEEEAKEKIKRYNPSCKEFYATTLAYEEGKRKLSDRIKTAWANGVYDDKITSMCIRHTSNQEKDFFTLVSYILDTNFKYEPFGINVRLAEEIDNHYFIYDAYYKTKEGIILFEYDGTYWHNKEKDEIRDETTFKYRSDILGIIRINDFYFYKNKQNLNFLKDAIEKIKNKECKRILFYENS